MAHRKGGHASSTREEAVDAVPTGLRLVVIVSCIAAIGAMAHGLWGTAWPAGGVTPEIASSTPLPIASSTHLPPSPDQSITPPATLPASPSPAIPHVGIVAGHRENDTGAVCPDGLTEAALNLDVAQRVVHTLQALGYQVTLLAEFDPRLTGYWADALVSIHADSCDAFPNAQPPASGFKVASVEDSLVPEAEKRLVACLAECYAARTGMYFHANSITYDMTRYHTFYEIDGRTPAAIIETGFMLNDRTILTRRADLVAQGIVDGIICFMEGEGR